MDTGNHLQEMGEEILNSLMVIQGLFFMVNCSNRDYERIVNEEVKRIVALIHRNCFSSNRMEIE